MQTRDETEGAVGAVGAVGAARGLWVLGAGCGRLCVAASVVDMGHGGQSGRGRAGAAAAYKMIYGHGHDGGEHQHLILGVWCEAGAMGSRHGCLGQSSASWARTHGARWRAGMRRFLAQHRGPWRSPAANAQ